MNAMNEITLSAPRSVISLASSALVVTVEVNVWTATKQDRSISDEVTTAKNASADAARFTKVLLSHSKEHKALINYRQTVSNWLRRLTFDWSGKARLLPVYRIEQFNNEYVQHELAFQKLLDDFLAAYPSLVSDAAFKQGAMFNRDEYPTVDVVRSKFRMRKLVHNVPEGDFRSSISEVIADDLRNHYESQAQEILNSVMQDMTGRLVTYASRMRKACEDVRADVEAEAGGKGKRRKVYESTYTQLRECIDMVRNFNMTNDPALFDAANKLEELMGEFSLTDLRESAFARSEVRDNLDDILGKFAPLSTFAAADDDGDE